MTRIVGVHYPSLRQDLLREALAVFYELRDVQGLKKRPSTSELLDWIRLLEAEGVPSDSLRRGGERGMPVLYGALLKSEQDVLLTEMALSQGRNRGRG
jgi:MoxR-like ATPase